MKKLPAPLSLRQEKINRQASKMLKVKDAVQRFKTRAQPCESAPSDKQNSPKTDQTELRQQVLAELAAIAFLEIDPQSIDSQASFSKQQRKAISKLELLKEGQIKVHFYNKLNALELLLDIDNKAQLPLKLKEQANQNQIVLNIKE